MLIRILIGLVLFFVPFLLYLSYVKMKRRRLGARASEEMTPWLMLVFFGLVIMTGAMIAMGEFFDYDAGVKLRSPAYVDGKIIPGGPVE
jgi:uncharacterized membrane protein YadS